jgi:hypothetical protein
MNDNISKISKISKTDNGDNESRDMEVFYDDENFEKEDAVEKIPSLHQEMKIIDDSKNKVKRIKLLRINKNDDEPQPPIIE